MALGKYKYAVQAVQETAGVEVAVDDIWSTIKNLDGKMGVIFHVMCAYGAGATRGLTVQVLQGINDSVPMESAEAAPISFDMPLLGVNTYVTVPVLLPEIGPHVALQLVNNTGDTAYVKVWSRTIDGMEVA